MGLVSWPGSHLGSAAFYNNVLVHFLLETEIKHSCGADNTLHETLL